MPNKRYTALTFVAIDVENANVVRHFYFNIVAYTECVVAMCTWQVFTEAAQEKNTTVKRTESTEQIRWMGPVSLELIRNNVHIYFYLFILYRMLWFKLFFIHANFVCQSFVGCGLFISSGRLSSSFWQHSDSLVILIKIKTKVCPHVYAKSRIRKRKESTKLSAAKSKHSIKCQCTQRLELYKFI